MKLSLLATVLFALTSSSALPARQGTRPSLTTSSGNAADTTSERKVRRPVSVAALDDGSRAFVAFQADGSLDVVDLAANQVITTLRVGPSSNGFRHVPVHVAIDPDQRHAYLAHAGASTISVIDVATATIIARLPSPLGNQRIAFDFGGGTRNIFVTNDREDAVLHWEEAPLGAFTRQANLPLEGIDPRPIATTPAGTLLVGNRGSHEIEELDPALLPGSPTVMRTALGSLPLDIEVTGSAYLVPTFTPTPAGPNDGVNEVLRFDLSTHQIVARFFPDLGTDYLDIEVRAPFVAITSAGSGSVLLADATTGALLQRLPLAPANSPLPVPVDLALTRAVSGGTIERLLVVNTLRETLQVIDLAGSPPFTSPFALPLSSSGRARIPFRDLSPTENGEWFFRSVSFFNGTATSPNPATCATCHPGGGSDGLSQRPTARQVPALFRPHETAPLGWEGQLPALSLSQIRGTFNTHGIFPGPPPAGADARIFDFLVQGNDPPRSPYLLPSGDLAPDAVLGRALFLGSAGCGACHAEPLFIPPPPAPLTISAGVGTGLVPANVPSLRGIWHTAPYLHDGSKASLRDLLLQNPGNLHGTTSQLTSQELDRLVLYLRSL